MCFVFVFAALLEYAAVNYNYWGRRARKSKDKKKNQTLILYFENFSSCRSTTDETGWPGASLNGEMQREAQEGVDWRVPKSFQQVIYLFF